MYPRLNTLLATERRADLQREAEAWRFAHAQPATMDAAQPRRRSAAQQTSQRGSSA